MGLMMCTHSYRISPEEQIAVTHVMKEAAVAEAGLSFDLSVALFQGTGAETEESGDDKGRQKRQSDQVDLELGQGTGQGFPPPPPRLTGTTVPDDFEDGRSGH